jgi:hypothetical protein
MQKMIQALLFLRPMTWCSGDMGTRCRFSCWPCDSGSVALPVSLRIKETVMNLYVQESVAVAGLKEQIELAEKAVIPPCMHSFCTQCIVQWLDLNRSCPLCKVSASQLLKYIGKSGVRAALWMLGHLRPQ